MLVSLLESEHSLVDRVVLYSGQPLKIVLNQPNLVGTVLIVMMVCGVLFMLSLMRSLIMNKNDFTVWELPQGAIARFGSGALCDLAVSPDGMFLAAGTGIGVWWYNLTTRQPVTLFETERGMVGSIALCSGQPWVALKDTDKEGKEAIKIWDLQRQQCISVMEYEDPPQIHSGRLYFSPSGEWIAVSRDGSVSVDIYESLTSKLHAEFELPPEDIELCKIDDWPDNGFHWNFGGALAFSPDNRLFASSHWADFISVWDITTLERIIRLTGHPAGVHSLSFSPCGQFLASGGVRGTIQVWETSTWQLQQTYPSLGDGWMDVSYAPDGTLRAAGISHDQCTVTLWDVAQQKALYTFHEKNYCDAEIYPIHFSNGTHLAFQSDFEVHVKTVRGTEPLAVLPWELGDLHSLVFSPDGKTLAAGYRQFGGVILWDVTTHQLQHVVTKPRCHIVAVYSDTATGKFYATGYPPGESDYWGNTLNLWEIGQSEPISELTIPGELPNRRAMAYAPATNLLACGNGARKDGESWDENDPENGAVYVWDIARGQMRHIFRGKHTNSINYVRFSPDGTRLISKCDDFTNRVWDVTYGEEICKELTGFIPEVFSLCGNLIAVFTGEDILAWDIEQCDARVAMRLIFLADLYGENPSVETVEFSPCGHYLAYGENWQKGLEKVPIQLFDIRTGENIATFLGHPTDIQCLAFSPDSTILASGSFDHTILLWDLKPYLST